MIGRVFLGRYEAIRLLGEGGMGRVYLARQLDLGRQVVVKIMHDHIANDPKFCDRFQRETLLMARFQHPYAVTLYDASLNDPQGACIVMEYIRGVTLDALLTRNGRLNPVRVGRLLGQLCEVLQAAHTESIIHRDLKPANLMVVDPDTPYEIIKVMDFGLAKLLGPRAIPMGVGSAAEFAIGTPGYMCPEQARGEDMDHRGDLYSVGVILYELLTGRLPFAGSSTMDVLLAHATENPQPFHAVGAGGFVAPAIEKVVHKCLAKLPADRPGSARELAEAYEAALIDEKMPDADVPSLPALPHAPSSEPAPRPSEPVTVHAPDPHSVVFQMEAWMPERIATYKLSGFVADVGGEVLESVPGKIRVRLGGRGSAYAASGMALSWIGLGRRSGLIDMELHLQRAEHGRENLLRITVLLRPCGSHSEEDWRHRCAQIFCDLRAYLIGQTGARVQTVS